MSQELCSECDKTFDPDDEWMAEYDPESICGYCVQHAKEKKAFKSDPLMQFARSYAS